MKNLLRITVSLMVLGAQPALVYGDESAAVNRATQKLRQSFGAHVSVGGEAVVHSVEGSTGRTGTLAGGVAHAEVTLGDDESDGPLPDENGMWTLSGSGGMVGRLPVASFKLQVENICPECRGFKVKGMDFVDLRYDLQSGRAILPAPFWDRVHGKSTQRFQLRPLQTFLDRRAGQGGLASSVEYSVVADLSDIVSIKAAIEAGVLGFMGSYDTRDQVAIGAFGEGSLSARVKLGQHVMIKPQISVQGFAYRQKDSQTGEVFDERSASVTGGVAVMANF